MRTRPIRSGTTGWLPCRAATICRRAGGGTSRPTPDGGRPGSLCATAGRSWAVASWSRPRAPLLASRDPAALDAVLDALRDHARRRRILLLKVQPPVNRTDLPELLGSRGLVASGLHTAPVASVVVDVGAAPDEDALFRALHATTRRRIRQARRGGVTVRTGTGDDLSILQDSI